MEDEHKTISILIIWRGKKLNVEINSDATVRELGHKLQNLTNVKPDTMRLLVPKSSTNGPKLLIPSSDEHSSLILQETSIFEGKSIRMMGVFEEEIKEVTQNGTKADLLRIAGFDEEEKRLRQRMLDRPQTSLKLPQGTYIFCDFRTLHIPGIELNPPASEALKIMHMLAADPGIVAIMNKHRWRVGIMTEMAPVGYVGVSSSCILGYNMNHGEEISLRLRTDDLEGFRKYESIKETLLHELAHMVYSEHDANFYTLDRQLNQEAVSLDWTRSRSRTLSGLTYSDSYKEEDHVGTVSYSSQKLGGKTSDELTTAHASSVAAAYQRLANASSSSSEVYVLDVVPDTGDSRFEVRTEPDPDDSLPNENMQIEHPRVAKDSNCEPHHDYKSECAKKFGPDHSDSQGAEDMEVEPYLGINGNGIIFGPNLDSYGVSCDAPYLRTNGRVVDPKTCFEPDPDESEASKGAPKNGVVVKADFTDSLAIETMHNETQPRMAPNKPDPNDSGTKGTIDEPDPIDSQAIESEEDPTKVRRALEEPDPDDSLSNGALQAEPDPDDSNEDSMGTTNGQADEPDPDDQELQRIQDPVTLVCTRLQKAIEMLKSEVNPNEATSVLQTLFKIIRNVIEHPNEIKFKRLRKANALFQRNVANYKAAMEVLLLVGFSEEVVSDEIGRWETYVVLKRNDPGLLWLAKSSLETCIVC